MKKAMIVTAASVFLLIGCAIGFRGGHRGDSLVIVPALPITVEIGDDQMYSQNGYYYQYRDNVWVYSQSQRGPWRDLPRDRYPREVHRRGQVDQGRHGDNRGDNRGDDRGDNHGNGRDNR